MECTLMVGDKVTLKTEHKFIGGYGDEPKPLFGVVYTVREVYPGANDLVFLRFAEIHGPRRLYSTKGGVAVTEISFNAARFRRVLPATDKQVEALKALVSDSIKQVAPTNGKYAPFPN